MRQSWLTPSAETRASVAKGGTGVFALVPIASGTTVAAFGGAAVDRSELGETRRCGAAPLLADRRRALPRERAPFDPADYVNHSCDPNCGIVGSVLLVAMRDIAADEEICFDYAMTDSDDYDQFVCGCGTELCRDVVSGDDWKLPELRDRYAGWFSTYLERRLG